MRTLVKLLAPAGVLALAAFLSAGTSTPTPAGAQPRVRLLRCPSSGPMQPQSMVIGPGGGGFRTPAGDSLYVPPGGVSAEQTFTLGRVPNGQAMTVEAQSSGPINEVHLFLNFARCPPGFDPTRLLVARAVSESEGDPVGGAVSGSYVWTRLSSLSPYAIASY